MQPASLHDHADVLQTARAIRHRPASDPVRTALLIASALATVLVGCVAVKTLLSNNQQQVRSIQSPR
jgi:hypothetical protein